ncbi:nuclear transport factor 2 family protein [Lacticaseibacillus pantheris]|jgi:hypothetical protein|uniref:nuclear transport factor 2 family protein n=1 Tax=Lacticaseibacillus pantheris TaxID=171523 RepID=UPI00265A6D2A|nr:nuclear transport factor 2 family protein [Lacticaseibacillus pantheris]WKF85699.1 nuclear transport factor 2 family protein [Lacticaseibacillus pantheris]
MSDIETISQLVLWERQARGRHLASELADCYWDDATVTTSWSSGLAKEAFVGQHPVDFDYSMPLVGRMAAPIVHQRGTRAYVELPSTTRHWLMLDGNEAVVESYMRLIYRLERRDGTWKISNLTSINEADTLSPAIPGTDLHVDPADFKGLRISYRFLAYTRIKAGGTINNDEIGTDRPETVQPVYDKAEAWLAGK